MARAFVLSASLIAATLLFASGCERPAIVTVNGSSTVAPITNAVAEEFTNREKSSVRLAGGIAGTGGGFKRFGRGELDVCNASRPITDAEREACEKNKIEYVELKIAFDGLAVVVNPKNDWVDCLTVAQLKAIWEPASKIAKWSDLDPAWPAEVIQLYGPDTDSGTFDYFTEVIVGETAKCRRDYQQNADDNVLVRGVAGNKFALGYFGLAYFEENAEQLKLLGIDSGDGNCVKPDAQVVRDNTYKPLSRPLFIYVKKSSLERPEVRAFIKFYVHNVGELVESVGYVPVPEEITAENKEALGKLLDAVKPATGA